MTTKDGSTESEFNDGGTRRFALPVQAVSRGQWALSVVSHGQGDLINKLLTDLTQYVTPECEVIVTLNLREDETFLRHFEYPIRIVRNERPKGFGANHNAAFAGSEADFFCVLNPDLRLPTLNLEALANILRRETPGACSPRVENSSGSIEDSARKFPTARRILSRVVNRGDRVPDYQFDTALVKVDWIAGMFMAFNAERYRLIGGFDEKYFMYLEDADICRRLRLAGFEVLVLTGAYVVHDARRASRRNLQHFAWHFRSLVRFLAGSGSK